MTQLQVLRAAERERHIQRLMCRCVHFTGIQHVSCKAGVAYHEQFGTGDGCFANIPCTHEVSAKVKNCPLVKYPDHSTASAEWDVMEAETAKAMVGMSAAHADAKAKGFGKGNGGFSAMPCPMCDGGELRYSIAGVNGHMHAGCSKCGMSWME